MKAIVVYDKGPADRLLIEEVPDPRPGPSDVIVEVSYSGVNHGDVIRRERGLFPKAARPPYVLGLEGAGIVGCVGDDVQRFRVGQRVAFLVESGGYAQRVCVPEAQLIPLPDSISDAVAAGSVCVGLTAYHLTRLARLKPEQSVLVHGGAGGVGSVLVQFCRQHGVRVFSTVGSKPKAVFAREHGADVVIDRAQESFGDRLLEITHGRGVDVIFDCIGKEVVQENFRCLAEGGLLLYYGSTSGHPQFPGGDVLMKELHIQGFVVFNTWRNRDMWREGVDGLVSALLDGSVRVAVKSLRMVDAAIAHRMLEGRAVSGKLVLDMEEPRRGT
jgi:NADPH:quinone reductase